MANVIWMIGSKWRTSGFQHRKSAMVPEVGAVRLLCDPSVKADGKHWIVITKNEDLKEWRRLRVDSDSVIEAADIYLWCLGVEPWATVSV